MRFPVLSLLVLVAACDVAAPELAPEADPAADDRSVASLQQSIVRLRENLRLLAARVDELEARDEAIQQELVDGLATVAVRQDEGEQAVKDLSTTVASLEAKFRTLDGDHAQLVKDLGGIRTTLDKLDEVFVSPDDDVYQSLDERLKQLGGATAAHATAIAAAQASLGSVDVVALDKRVSTVERTVYDDYDIVELSKQVAGLDADRIADDMDDVLIWDKLKAHDAAIVNDDIDFLALTDRVSAVETKIGEDDVDYELLVGRVVKLEQTVADDMDIVWGRLDALDAAVGPTVMYVDDADFVSLDARVTKVEGETSWLGQQVEALWDAIFPPPGVP